MAQTLISSTLSGKTVYSDSAISNLFMKFLLDQTRYIDLFFTKW